jgi:hypothetical protein
VGQDEEVVALRRQAGERGDAVSMVLGGQPSEAADVSTVVRLPPVGADVHHGDHHVLR